MAGQITLFNRILAAFGLGGLQNPERGRQATGPHRVQSDAGIMVTDERALQVSTLWACARILTNSIASLPLNFMRVNGSTRKPLESTHSLNLVFRRPNQFMSGMQFRFAMCLQRVLWGNAYAYIQRGDDGRPIALVPLLPQYVEVDRTPQGLLYHYESEARTIVWSQRSILHLKGFSPDGIVGLSPLAYAKHSLGIAISADRYAARSFSGRPNGVLMVDKFLTDSQRQQMRDLYGQVESSVVGDGSWWLLEGGMSYEAITPPPDTLQMLESRQFNVPEICRFMGVPAVMVDGSAGAESAWPSSYEQQVLSFLTFTLRPYLEEWEDVIKNSLVLPSERAIIAEHDAGELLRTDSAGRADYYSKMIQNGIMSRDEARIRERLKPRGGAADELTAQVNMATLTKLGEQDDALSGQPATSVRDQNQPIKQ